MSIEAPYDNILDAPAVLAMPERPAPPRSVEESLRAQHETAQRRKTVGIKIPGYDTLYGVFRAVGDFAEIYEATEDERKHARDEAGMTLGFALDLLALASVATYAVVDGERYDMQPLGLDLYDRLFPAQEGTVRPGTDKEAIVLLFPLGTFSLVEVATRYDAWQKGEAAQTDEELLGNS